MTRRHTQIIGLIASGKQVKEIASTLHICPGTVSAHIKAIHRIYGLHSKADVAQFAAARKIISESYKLQERAR